MAEAMVNSIPTRSPGVPETMDDEESLSSSPNISYVQQLRQQQQEYFEEKTTEHPANRSDNFFNASFGESDGGLEWAEDIIDHGEAEVLVVESQQTHMHHVAAEPEMMFAEFSDFGSGAGYCTDGGNNVTLRSQRTRARELGLDASEHSRHSTCSQHSNHLLLQELQEANPGTQLSKGTVSKDEDNGKRSSLARSSSEGALRAVNAPLHDTIGKKPSFQKSKIDSDDQSRISKASRRSSNSKEIPHPSKKEKKRSSKKASNSSAHSRDMDDLASRDGSTVTNKKNPNSKKKKKKSGGLSVADEKKTEKKKQSKREKGDAPVSADLRETLMQQSKQKSTQSVGTKSTTSRSSSVPPSIGSSSGRKSSSNTSPVNKKKSKSDKPRDGMSLEQQFKKDRRRSRRSKAAKDEDHEDEASVASSILDQSRSGPVRALDPTHRMMRRHSNEMQSSFGSLGHHFASNKGPAMQLDTEAMSLHGGEKRYGKNLNGGAGGFSSSVSLPGGAAATRRGPAKLGRSTSSGNVAGKKKRVAGARRRGSFDGDGDSTDGGMSSDDDLDDILARSRQRRGRSAKRSNSITGASSSNNCDNNSVHSMSSPTRRATISTSTSASLASSQNGRKKIGKQQRQLSDQFSDLQSPPSSPRKKGGNKKGLDFGTFGTSFRDSKDDGAHEYDDLDSPMPGTKKKGLVSRIFGGGRR